MDTRPHGAVTWAHPPRSPRHDRACHSAVYALSRNRTRAQAADPPPVVDVEGQPLAANAERLAKALDFLGAPLPADTAKALAKAIDG